MTLSTVKNSLLLGLLAILLSGCASFGKGVAEAFLEKSNAEDTRVCQVKGKPFEGIAPSLAEPKGKTKVLMVEPSAIFNGTCSMKDTSGTSKAE